MRSNVALRTHTYDQAPARLLRCNGLVREVAWWSPWRGPLDGMQGVRGSNPLSSTLGLDEHGRAQHLAVTSSASDRAIALTWQLAPRRSMMLRKPKLSMTELTNIEWV